MPGIWTIISIGLKWIVSCFMPSKDENLGQLEVISKGQENELSDIQKSEAARARDNSALDSELRRD